jgi:hypothetical protein
VKTVEEKMRLEMSAECLQAGGGKLSLQPGGREQPFLISLVQRDRGARAGDGRIDQQLYVQPAAQLDDEAAPDPGLLIRERRAEQYHRERLNDRDHREHRQMCRDQPDPAAEPLGQPVAGELPHPDGERNPDHEIHGLPDDGSPDVHALAGVLRRPQDLRG